MLFGFFALIALGNAEQKVDVLLASESLCPDCIKVFKQQLSKVYKTDALKMMSLTLLPYGNAHQTFNGTHWVFSCQHGQRECDVNMFEACAIYLTNNSIKDYFPLIECIESAKDPYASAEACVAKTKFPVPLKRVSECVKGKEGNSLMHEIGLLTENLNPPHKYVPWFVINGEHSDEIQEACEKDLTKVLCQHYKGELPSSCKRKI